MIAIDAILAASTELTRIALALVDLCLAESAGEAWEAAASEGIFAVYAGTAVARIRLTIVDVSLARGAGESWRALARVLGYGILARAAVATRR